jgi:hypothetical protein
MNRKQKSGAKETVAVGIKTRGENFMTRESMLKHFFMISMVVVLTATAAFAQTTAFSYQGRLSEAGNPVTGTRFFRLTLFDENGLAIAGATVDRL